MLGTVLGIKMKKADCISVFIHLCHSMLQAGIMGKIFGVSDKK